MLHRTLLRRWYQGGQIKNDIPSPGMVSWGHLRRFSPFSTEFGFDRGGPVDRYYIEEFLQKHASHIQGRVLEIGDNHYTLQLGKGRITRSDILHVNGGNPKATIIGDLADLPHVAGSLFDCIILTQTLQLIYGFEAALQTCYRILADQGVLLLTVPGITNTDNGAWGKTWYWSFTVTSINRLMAGIFGEENIQVEGFGNILSATAFLYGMGKAEISDREKDWQDPCYPLIVAALGIKKGNPDSKG